MSSSSLIILFALITSTLISLTAQSETQLDSKEIYLKYEKEFSLIRDKNTPKNVTLNLMNVPYSSEVCVNWVEYKGKSTEHLDCHKQISTDTWGQQLEELICEKKVQFDNPFTYCEEYGLQEKQYSGKVRLVFNSKSIETEKIYIRLKLSQNGSEIDPFVQADVTIETNDLEQVKQYNVGNKGYLKLIFSSR